MPAIPSGRPVSGPRPVPLLGWRGNMVLFLRDPVAYMTRLYREHGGVAAFVDGGNDNLIFSRRDVPRSPRTYFCFSPEANYDLLTKTDVFYGSGFEGPDTPAFQNLAYNHIFAMGGDKHRQQRRLIMPAFHKKRVESYRDEMVAYTERMLEGWPPGATRDLRQEMTRLTLYIANRTLFGSDVKDVTDSIGSMIGAYLDLSISPLTRIRVNRPFTPYGKLARLAGRLDADIRSLIAARRAEGGERPDMLSMMIAATDEEGNRLDEAELVGHTTTLFIAGHETSANGLAWTLFLLSQHPRVLDDLEAELTGELRGAAPTLDQLGRLPLLDRVIKESLRLFPPASMLGRVARAPATVASLEVPAGTEIFYSPYVTHRIPELYRDPGRFDPGRWEALDPSPYEYLPFSAGPRMCIGTAFATMEMKIILSIVLQRVRPELHPGASVNRNLVVTLNPKPGLPMILHRPRDGARRRPAPVRGDVREMVDLPS
jgi:cytochrome P450